MKPSRILLAASLLASFCGAAQGQVWKRYDNGRFGFSVCYPADVFVPQGESTNGDGQTFKTSDHKTTVLAFGGFELESDKGKSGFEQELGFALQTAKDRHFDVTYKVVKPHLFVLSGASPAGMVWYRRTQELQGRAITLDFEYPQADKARMDPLIARMTACLAVGHMSN